MAVDYISALNTKGSGLNITQIVDSLVDAETQPKKDLINEKIEQKNLDISAIGKLTSEINTLKTSLTSLTNLSKFKTVSGNTAANISISDTGKAKEFNSDLRVVSLATPQTLEFSGFALPTSSVGSGSIFIEFGNWIDTDGTTTDNDSLFAANSSVSTNTALGTPLSHTSLGGKITITTSSGGNQSSTAFTVVGKDMAGNDITEIITGGGDGATVTGSKVFKSVTSITPGSTVGSGTIKVGHLAQTFGPNSSKSAKTISIAQGSSSLQTVADTLNNVTGVNASVINKGDGTYSLVVRSDTGRNNAIRLTVTENSGDTGLSTLDTSSDNDSHQTSASADASLLVDGVTIKRDSNTITDVYDGYTLSISSSTTSTFRVSSNLDTENSLTSLKSFVSSFNQTNSLIEELTRVSTSADQSGPLSDDVTVKNIRSQLNNLINGKIEGFGTKNYYTSLLGVQTNRDGSLSIDDNKFKKNFETDSTAFDAIFNTKLSSDSPFLTLENDLNSKPLSGTYSFRFDSGSSTAFLDGRTMTSGTDSNGNTFYASTIGDSKGIKITPSQTVSSANVFYGKSLVEKLDSYVTKLLSVSGELTQKKTTINSEIGDLNIDLDDIDINAKTLEERYKKQFSAMESIISSFKNTGEFLTNLMDATNNKD